MREARHEHTGRWHISETEGQVLRNGMSLLAESSLNYPITQLRAAHIPDRRTLTSFSEPHAPIWLEVAGERILRRWIEWLWVALWQVRSLHADRRLIAELISVNAGCVHQHDYRTGLQQQLC